MIRRAALLVILIALSGGSVQAQVGLCTTEDGPCSSLADQLLQYTEQGLQLNQETITAVQEYTSALPLGITSFQDLTDEINKILGIVNTASMIVGQTSQIIVALTGSSGYAPAYGAGFNWHQESSNQFAAIGRSMQVCGQALSLLQGLGNDAQLLATLVNQIQAVLGRQQSLQTLGSQISQLGQSIQKAHSGLMGCYQSQNTYFAMRAAHQYMIQSVADLDLDITSANECAAITLFSVSWCAGEGGAGGTNPSAVSGPVFNNPGNGVPASQLTFAAAPN